MESRYVRILGSSQEVVRLMWLIKYVSPALVIASSQPSGNELNPNAFADLVNAGFTSTGEKKKRN